MPTSSLQQPVLFSDRRVVLRSGKRVRPRDGLLEDLRQRIRSIETRYEMSVGDVRSGLRSEDLDLARAVPFGVAEIDRRLPERGLTHGGVHEVRPAGYGDMPAAHMFLASAIARRQALGRFGLITRDGNRQYQPGLDGPVVWCVQSGSGWDCGRLFGHGLDVLGLDPGKLIIVTPRTRADAMWALEEALNSGSISAVVGLVQSVRPTEARRLSLAAQSRATPCFLLTHHNAPTAAVAYTRWRVGAGLFAQSQLEDVPIHVPRWRLELERVRHGPHGLSWNVRWCHEAYCFRLVSPLANAEIAPTPVPFSPVRREMGERAVLQRAG